MQVRSLGWEDPLEEGMATHSKSCLESPRARGACGLQSMGLQKSRPQLKLTLTRVSTGSASKCLPFLFILIGLM